MHKGQFSWRAALTFLRIGIAAVLVAACSEANAAGGYFVLGYGPDAHQSAGTSTAIGFDSFAGASNPAKLARVSERLDLGVILFMPYRKIERSNSGTPFDFSSTSKNSFFLLPEIGFAKRITKNVNWAISVFGNGGLNTDYVDGSGVPQSNANPQSCGDEPGNFFLGCGKLGFDLSQLIIAPTLSWALASGHSIGVSPLLGFQRFSAYGLQAFEAVSETPTAVSNRGYDQAFGGGIRVGWFAQILPWVDLGASYSTRIYMEKFNKYRGLLADSGAFDVPANYSIGLAIRPHADWQIGLDVQRILYGEIPALNNGVLNSLSDPQNSPLGSKDGSGFNWRDQTNYRIGLAYTASENITVRAGFAYGQRPVADSGENSVSFNMLAPNPVRNITAGLSWALNSTNQINIAAGNYIKGTYSGPSATSGLGVGGQESITAYVTTVYLGWTWSLDN